MQSSRISVWLTDCLSIHPCLSHYLSLSSLFSLALRLSVSLSLSCSLPPSFPPSTSPPLQPSPSCSFRLHDHRISQLGIVVWSGVAYLLVSTYCVTVAQASTGYQAGKREGECVFIRSRAIPNPFNLFLSLVISQFFFICIFFFLFHSICQGFFDFVVCV